MGLCRTGVSCADPALRNGNAAAHPPSDSSADGHSAGSSGYRTGNGSELECGEHRAGRDPGFTRCHYYPERKGRRPLPGRSTTRRAVESQLEKRGVRTVELLVDLRMQPEEPAVSSQKRIELPLWPRIPPAVLPAAGWTWNFSAPGRLHSADACRRAKFITLAEPSGLRSPSGPSGCWPRWQGRTISGIPTA